MKIPLMTLVLLLPAAQAWAQNAAPCELIR